MALSQRLQLRQSQSLAMTPQLMQAIKLLQYSSLDLSAYVEAELERNPLLERDEREGEPVTDRESAGESAQTGERSETEVTPEAGSEPTGFEDGTTVEENADWMNSPLETDPTEIAAKLDTQVDDVYPDDPGNKQLDAAQLAGDSWASAGTGPAAAGDGGYDIEAYVSDSTTLADHLADQLAMAVPEPVERIIGQYLIDSLDEAGYLRVGLDAVAEALGISITQVEDVLEILHGFEPTGVFARNLPECLALQLKDRDRYDPAMATLIDNIDLLGKRDFAALRRLCSVDDEDLGQMFAEIRALDPKPGHSFGSEAMQPVVPDVTVRQGPDGGWLVDLNSDTLPKVLVSQTYFAQVSKTAKGTEKTYLTDCLQTANWLVKALDQRAKTILKVSAEIVRQQDGFLMYGVQHLRPLNLKTVADAIDMHESTVSRVTSNKYMATSRGIFELKYFFTSAIPAASGGEAHSAEAVRHRIKQMIEGESHASVLSDDAIVNALMEVGVDIARRTVAKYREAMRIPSSVQRRREKRALANSGG